MLSLSLYPTLECAMGCDYCMVDEYKRKSRMSLDTVREVMRKSRGVTDLHVHIVGGEPLQYGGDKLIEMLELIKKEAHLNGQNLTLGMITNGVLMTGLIASRLAELDVDLYISYDGYSKDYKRVLLNMRETRHWYNLQGKDITAIAVLSGTNKSYYNRVLDDIVIDAGVKKVIAQPNIKENPQDFYEALCGVWTKMHMIPDLEVDLFSSLGHYLYTKDSHEKFLRGGIHDGSLNGNLYREIHVHPEGTLFPAMPSDDYRGYHLSAMTNIREYFATEEYSGIVRKHSQLMANLDFTPIKYRDWLMYSMGGNFIFDVCHRGLDMSQPDLQWADLTHNLLHHMRDNPNTENRSIKRIKRKIELMNK